MKKQKSFAMLAFQQQLTGLATKLSNVDSTTPLEEFCKIGNNIRTSFFMMEALCRIYSEVYGEKPFDKWLKKCKVIEDTLGELDFYSNEVLPHSNEKEQKSINAKIQNAYKTAISILESDEWLSGERIKKMENKLSAIQIDNEEQEIQLYLKKEIESIIDFHKKITYEEMEEEVHEMRRKVRWISIYAQCLNGIVQLKKVESEQNYQKYLTEEVLTSKFNTLPPAPKSKQIIYFNQNAFYAMSWIISELGKIKDEGLVLLYQKASPQKVKELASKAKDICTVFIEKDTILQNLIVK